jgi:DNA-binding HxlR family transcriptional regulator
MSTQQLEDLVALGRNRWSATLLADLAAHNGARFVELAHRIGLPRDSLARTLAATRDAGWVIPNPGHGHPLRPEYILTPEGARMAVQARSLIDAQARIGIGPDRMTRWSVPIVLKVHQGCARFNAIARSLALASPRAISQGLRSLADNGLLLRELVDDYPPTSQYRLTDEGLLLASAVEAPA